MTTPGVSVSVITVVYSFKLFAKPGDEKPITKEKRYFYSRGKLIEVTLKIFYFFAVRK